MQLLLIFFFELGRREPKENYIGNLCAIAQCFRWAVIGGRVWGRGEFGVSAILLLRRLGGWALVVRPGSGFAPLELRRDGLRSRYDRLAGAKLATASEDRRGGDSNPRCRIRAHTLSKRAP